MNSPTTVIRLRRRPLTVATIVTGAVLALSSTAVACTFLVGHGTLTSKETVSKVLGDGTSSSMVYCSTVPNSFVRGAKANVADGVPDTITIEVAPQPAVTGIPGLCPGSLGTTLNVADFWHLTYSLNLYASATSSTIDDNCMSSISGQLYLQEPDPDPNNPANATKTKDARMATVDGSGVKEVLLPTGLGASNTMGICVSHPGHPSAVMIPLELTTTGI